VQIEKIAIADSDGQVNFTIESNTANSHISDIEITHAKKNIKKNIIVEQFSLDTYLENKTLNPNIIKIDVEGAEVRVLRGAIKTLNRFKPMCIISTHSNELSVKCIKILEDLNYEISKLKGFDHELICIPK
jgi:FkbM family methyltransferase